MADYAHNPNLLPIADVIPHRPPLLWLSGVQEFDPGVSVQGFWTPGDEQFEGHFPGQPILQGVQQLEALAQLGCYATMYHKPGELGVLLTRTSVDFFSPVFPGETLELEVKFANQTGKSVFEGIGKAAVNGEVTCQAEFAGKIVPKAVLNRLIDGARQQRV